MATSASSRASNDPSTPPSPPEPHPVPRPVSERRRAANRANARKSTGPRTAAGKSRSRMNALRHGLTASVGLLPGEDGAALRDLSAAIHADLRPRGHAEAVLVDQYVSIAWKLRRLGAAERQIAAEEFGRDLSQFFDDRDNHEWALRQPGFKEKAESFGPPTPPEGKAAAVLVYQDLDRGSGPLLRLMDLEMRLRGTLTAVVKQLKDLRALRRQQAEDERDEEDGLDPWVPGEWDDDPQRFGTSVADAGDEGGPEENAGQDDGEELTPPAPHEVTRRNNLPPPAQNEPIAQAEASPEPRPAQPAAAAPDTRPAQSAAVVQADVPPPGSEPMKATDAEPPLPCTRGRGLG